MYPGRFVSEIGEIALAVDLSVTSLLCKRSSSVGKYDTSALRARRPEHTITYVLSLPQRSGKRR